jgi:hypothetical protein
LAYSDLLAATATVFLSEKPTQVEGAQFERATCTESADGLFSGKDRRSFRGSASAMQPGVTP